MTAEEVKQLTLDEAISANRVPSRRPTKEDRDAILIRVLDRYPDKGPVIRAWEEKNEKRLDHALKRMKAKGFWTDDVDRLSYLASKCGYEGYRLWQMALCLMDFPDTSIVYGPIEDNTWKAAIETAMYVTEQDIFKSMDAMFGQSLEQHLPVIYMLTLLFYYARDIHSVAYRLFKRLEGHEEYMKKEEEVAKVTATLATSVVEAGERNTDLKQRLEKAESMVSKQRRSLDKVKFGYEKMIADLERQLAIARGEAVEDEPVEADEDADDTPVVEPEDEGREWHALPETGIVFIGGNQNMVKKLRQRHPGWTYLESDNVNFQASNGAAGIFMFYKTIGHTTLSRMNRVFDAGIPRFWVSKVNLDALEAEMTELWSDWLDFGIRL